MSTIQREANTIARDKYFATAANQKAINKTDSEMKEQLDILEEASADL